ncbi:MAG: FAD-dependent oxidoreductase [Gordonia sp. (in: high G+C Gram-positive bacteria)]
MPAKEGCVVVSSRVDVAVIGGGVIGLTCALTAADAGLRVAVYDAGRDRRASWVAGGMLGSLGEGMPGEERLLAITSASVRRWPALVRRLDDTGTHGLGTHEVAAHKAASVMAAADSLFVATTSADLAALRQLAEISWDAGLVEGRQVRALDPVWLREVEPSLSSRVRGGYLAIGEGAVDNRRLLSRLGEAIVAAGGTLVGRTIGSLADIDAGQVLLAAGAGVRELWSGARIHLAKGEILRLRRTAWCVPPPTHVVRARVGGRAVYLVPRDDGIVVGATQYESEEESGAEVGGVADLLADAIEVMPGLRNYTLAEVGVGWRPCSADGLPIIRRLDDRVCVAAGMGRNGIVLAPYVAGEVLGLLAPAFGMAARDMDVTEMAVAEADTAQSGTRR